MNLHPCHPNLLLECVNPAFVLYAGRSIRLYVTVVYELVPSALPSPNQRSHCGTNVLYLRWLRTAGRKPRARVDVYTLEDCESKGHLACLHYLLRYSFHEVICSSSPCRLSVIEDNGDSSTGMSRSTDLAVYQHSPRE